MFKVWSNSNFVHTMFKFSRKNSYFVHRMFKFSGKGSYSAQSMLTFVHWLFKSNKLKCPPLSISSNYVLTMFKVQTLFKLCSKFNLCSNYVQSSYLFKLRGWAWRCWDLTRAPTGGRYWFACCSSSVARICNFRSFSSNRGFAPRTWEIATLPLTDTLCQTDTYVL